MTEKFSAASYAKFSDVELRAEAQRLKVNVDGFARVQMINAVYNAELRRRGEEQAAREAQEGDESPSLNQAPSSDASQRIAELEAENERLQRELEAMKLQLSKVDDESDYQDMTVAMLRELADQRGIDLSDASRKADIIAALEEDDQAKG
jgi:hypothetical protein